VLVGSVDGKVILKWIVGNCVCVCGGGLCGDFGPVAGSGPPVGLS
jgi:hypothetical protein